MDASKRFILIVGDNTTSVRSGSCQYCGSLNSRLDFCIRGHSVDRRSYIEFECEKAIEAGIDIVVLYNAASINRSKCPSILRDNGKHIAMCYQKDGVLYWDYGAVKNALS